MDTDQPLAVPQGRSSAASGRYPQPSEVPAVDADLLERARAAAAGYPELEEVLRRLDALNELDVEQLPAEFDAIHGLLRAALGDVPS